MKKFTRIYSGNPSNDGKPIAAGIYSFLCYAFAQEPREWILDNIGKFDIINLF